MTTPEVPPPKLVWNDLLFESLAAELDYHERIKALTAVEVERLASVLGKPSQFVGRVTNFDLAIRHWEMWDRWQATEGALLNAQHGAPVPPPPDNREAIQAANVAWRNAITDCTRECKKWDDWCQAEITKIREQTAAGKAQWMENVRLKREEFRALKAGQ